MANLQQLEIDFSPEIWKDILGYEGYYQVSNQGRVKSLRRLVCYENTSYYKPESILKNKLKSNGYYCVALCLNGNEQYLHVHRLVATAFIPNPENKPQVNHIWPDKTNNRVSNLEWVTQAENNIHARKNIIFKYSNLLKGEDATNAHPVVQLSEAGKELFIWGCLADAARYYDINYMAIRQSILEGYKARGFLWQTITKEYYLANKHRFSNPPVAVVSKIKRDLSKAFEARMQNRDKITKDVLVHHGTECYKLRGALRRDIYEEYARIHKAPGYRFIRIRFVSFDNFKKAVLANVA